jgi:hypothetical protein
MYCYHVRCADKSSHEVGEETGTALHCTALYCTVLYCVRCTALSSIVLKCVELYCTVRTTIHCTILISIALYCTVMLATYSLLTFTLIISSRYPLLIPHPTSIPSYLLPSFPPPSFPLLTIFISCSLLPSSPSLSPSLQLQETSFEILRSLPEMGIFPGTEVHYFMLCNIMLHIV